GKIVVTALAEPQQSARDEDESAGQGKGVGLRHQERAEDEDPLLLTERTGEQPTNLGKPAGDLRVGIGLGLFEDIAGQVVTHSRLRPNRLGLGAGQGAKCPVGLARLMAKKPTQLVEEASQGFPLPGPWPSP